MSRPSSTVLRLSWVLGLACAVGCGDDDPATGEGGGDATSTTSTTSGSVTSSTSSGGPGCPDAAPTDGTACDAAGQVCTYEEEEECEGTVFVEVTATCTSGSWDVTRDSPCVEPEDCPGAMPTAGESCEPPGEGTCFYETDTECFDGSLGIATAEASCVDGAWELDVTVVSACCPGAPPPSGTPGCQLQGQSCAYEGDVVCAEGGSIPGAIESTCEGGRWQSAYEPTGGVCADGTACPLEPPTSGSACDPEIASASCLWEEPTVCPDGPGYLLMQVATCGAEGVWATSTLFEGTECASCPGGAPFEACDVEGMACVMDYAGNCVDEETGETSEMNVTVGVICEGGEWIERWGYEECY